MTRFKGFKISISADLHRLSSSEESLKCKNMFSETLSLDITRRYNLLVLKILRNFDK